jgi:hypothetical protein
MNDAKYIGMDVHTATISAAVRDSSGNLVMEATLETKAGTILEFVRGLGGSLRVSFEEGTCASWLHDLLKPHVTEVLVCDSRKNAKRERPGRLPKLSCTEDLGLPLQAKRSAGPLVWRRALPRQYGSPSTRRLNSRLTRNRKSKSGDSESCD